MEPSDTMENVNVNTQDKDIPHPPTPHPWPAETLCRQGAGRWLQHPESVNPVSGPLSKGWLLILQSCIHTAQ